MTCSLFDLGARGRIKVTGEDRARLLHAMTTNHVEGLQPGGGLYAFFLNAQGRIQADVNILCFADHLLLDTEPETRAQVLEHLDRFIIADDATLEDVTNSTFCLALAGGDAAGVAAAAGLVAPDTAFAHTTTGGVTSAAICSTGDAGVQFYGPLELKASLVETLVAAGAVPGTPHEAETARIRNFVPRYGADITAAMLPQETRMMHAIHFQKGCYLGQEIVERVRSRGHVNRQLMGFRMAAEAAPAVATPVTAEGKVAGEVTSSVATPEGVFGLASVRVPHDKPGTRVTIEGHEAELFLPAGA